MDFQELQYEVTQRVATVTLNRPSKLNAWTLQMAAEVRQAMRMARDDAGVHVIVLTGAGRGFCAGGDMGLLDNIRADSAQHAAPLLPPFDLHSPPDFHGPDSYFPTIPKPILCALNGPAVGIGLVYALYCDLRFASDQAYMVTAFSRRGAVAEHGCAWLLPRIVGLANSLDLLYSGRRVDAQEALRLGLVNRVVPAQELLPAVQTYASMLANEVSPRSLAVMKRQVWSSLTRSLGEDVAVSMTEMALGFQSADFDEGIVSFLERRAPNFTGG